MKLTRRRITQFGLIGLSGMSALAARAAVTGQATQKLSILVLGGTGFLGPHIVSTALARGHELTLFNRGKTGSNTFEEAETIKGNRAGDLKGLKGKSWDVVIDTSSFLPQQVRKSSELLARSVDHYIYLSSMSVYKDTSRPNLDESAAVHSLSGPDAADMDPFYRYGASKYMCEQVVQDVFGKRGMSIRSDTIVGPGDHRHFRYVYWVRRATQEGNILGPGSPDDFVQYIDVRDLADWIVRCAENSTAGVYNATSNPAAYTMLEMIKDCQSAAATDAPIEWVDHDFLIDRGIFDIPFWQANPDALPASGQYSNAAALQRGLKIRPKATTAEDTLAWYRQLSPEVQSFKAGPTLEEEQALLAAWNTRSDKSA